MKKIIALSTIIFWLNVPYQAYGGDFIGIYFDEEADCSCLAESLYLPVSAYLTVTNSTLDTGVAGWEGRLDIDSGVFVTVDQYFGESLNIGSFPEFVVGLGSPIPSDSIIILAKFSVFATAPGGARFTAASNPSIPGSILPIYLDENGGLHELTPITGNTVDPLIQIGYGNCGNQDSCDSLVVIVPEGQADASPGEIREPDLVVQFPHGSQEGQFGYTGTKTEIAEIEGVLDFEIGADGFTYVLDAVNNRIVILDGDLEWMEEIPINKRFSEIKLYNKGILASTPENNSFGLIRKDNGWSIIDLHGDSLDSWVREEKISCIELSGRRESDSEYLIIGTYSEIKDQGALFSWQLFTGKKSRGVSLASDKIYENSLFLNVDFLSSQNDLEPFLVVFDLEGQLSFALEKPSTVNCEYRLPISTRVGTDGSIEMMRIFQDYTEVTKWK